MRKNNLEAIITRARQEPDFFHSLVFNPESLRSVLEELDPLVKKRIFAINPSHMINNIISSKSFKCDASYTSSGPCGGTCGGRTCDVTCSEESCGRTCDDSCGYTTDYAPSYVRGF